MNSINLPAKDGNILFSRNYANLSCSQQRVATRNRLNQKQKTMEAEQQQKKEERINKKDRSTLYLAMCSCVSRAPTMGTVYSTREGGERLVGCSHCKHPSPPLVRVERFSTVYVFCSMHCYSKFVNSE